MPRDNLLDLCYPGLYEISCVPAERSYFGESDNVMARLSRHFDDLQAHRHENQSLQDDWKQYGRENFFFRVLEKGPAWEEAKTRRVREQEYITTCPHAVYNAVKPVASTFRKKWTVDGITYSSGAEAARQLNCSPSQIYRLMKKKGSSEQVSNFKRISVDGQDYASLSEALKVLKISRTTLIRRLRSPEYPTWFYVEKTRSNDYPERE